MLGGGRKHAMHGFWFISSSQTVPREHPLCPFPPQDPLGKGWGERLRGHCAGVWGDGGRECSGILCVQPNGRSSHPFPWGVRWGREVEWISFPERQLTLIRGVCDQNGNSKRVFESSLKQHSPVRSAATLERR